MKRYPYAAMLIAAVAMLSACGGDDDPAPSTGAGAGDPGAGGSGMGGAGGNGSGGAGQGGTGQGGAAQGGAGGGGGEGGAGGGAPQVAQNGAPCMTKDECGGGVCITEPGDGWPLGYCTELCALIGGMCTFGGQCIDVGVGGGKGSCFVSCSVAGMDCRDGYACQEISGGQGVCSAGCTTDAQCPVTNKCVVDKGLCEKPPGMTEVGLPCAQSFECKSNKDDPFCITEADQGWPKGYCSELCDLMNDDCSGDAICLDLQLNNGKGLCLDGCAVAADCPTMGYACKSMGPGKNVCMPAM